MLKMTSKSSDASEADQKIVKQTLAWIVDAVEQISDDVQMTSDDFKSSTDSTSESESLTSESDPESDSESDSNWDHAEDCEIVYVKKEALEASDNFEYIKEVVDDLLKKVEASENSISVHVENESESFEESAEDPLLQVSMIFPASKNARALQESSSTSNKRKVPKRRFVLSESDDSDDGQPQPRRLVVSDSEDSDDEKPRILEHVPRARRIQGIVPIGEPDAPNGIAQAFAAIIDVPPVPQANPPSMTMQRDVNMHEWCIRIGRKIESDHSPAEIQKLIESSLARTRLFQRYQETHWLAQGGLTEAIPIYANLMAPLTKEAYLDGLRLNQMPTANLIHLKIFEASWVNDSDTRECLQMALDGRRLKTCLLLIKQNDPRWREIASRNIPRSVFGSIEVDTVDQVPDFGFLACFETMPNFETIQAKQLNCLVIYPSAESFTLIFNNYNIYEIATVYACAYGGSEGTLPYICFGPRIEAVERGTGTQIPTSTSVKGAFMFSMKTLCPSHVGRIYTVNGYF
ncbi:unnamed protein product [Caenorhabditis nigoni]